MGKLIPDPKAPNESTDYIYGERLAPFEERMNFFQNEKVVVKKDNVKDEDKAEVDGLESLIQRFSDWGKLSLPGSVEVAVEGGTVAGVEGSDQPIPWTKYFIQLAKEAVDFILNFINNRIARIDNRTYRTSLNRKRLGVKSVEVTYPAGIRRLIVPLTISTDPNWVVGSIDTLRDFYKQSIQAYRFLTASIKNAGGETFDLTRSVDETIRGVAKCFKMKAQGETYGTDILPGNRRMYLNEVTDGSTGGIGIYFSSSGTDARMRTNVFTPTGYLIDNTLKSIDSTIKEIRSNQSTVSQLYRTFERDVVKYQTINNLRMGADGRQYLGWLVRFAKRLMNMVLIYVINGLDCGLDFCNAGIQDDN
ncbi:putative virion structural protein [Pseudomonas phage OBP]|uniref:putative virion structural protein n=1 Tax=Pseudomonas phage OBP TaxID=1124849 RepID=UPI000240D49F|nr:putative virion structural protein [Pseudomonas phage OBP]AEV89550.1 putative virion structural protein [Pseudomonas phage OBP]